MAGTLRRPIPGWIRPGARTASWRTLVLGFWSLSRLALFLNVVVGHHLCDRVFWLYGHRAVALHMLPYRDYSVEYPPLAAALFVLPGAAPTYDAYAAIFAALMLLVDLLTLLLVRAAAEKLGLWANGWRAAFAYAALSFAGGAVLIKFDLLPALLALLAVVLLVQERDAVAWIALAAAVLVKGYPIVLAPLFVLYRYRRGGSALWWRGPLAGALAASLVLLPVFLVAGPRVAQGFLYHARRGLEIESSYASIILIAQQVAHLRVTVTPGVETTSRDVFSSLDAPLIAAAPWVLAACLVAVYIVSWVRLRADPTPEALLLLAMAAVGAFMLAFKALPSYYLLWLIPPAAVALGRPASRTASVAMAFGLAVGLGALIPVLWLPLRHFDTFAVAVMAGRNLAIAATVALLLMRAWPRRSVRPSLDSS